jgi:Fe-S-cluster containining protein
MTEPLPCPFCGHVGLSHNEGSTFRWLMTECNGCGAQCGEERINTMSMDRSAAIERAKESAVVSWNTRAAQRAWVGLTDEDFLEACQIAERGNYLLALRRIQTKLKERNT